MTDIHHADAPDDQVELLDEQARLSRLVTHLARLVNRGGRVEEQHGYRAVVSMPQRQQMLPNVLMAAAGVGLFIWVGEPFFLLGGFVALLGWHKKLVAGAERMRVMVRVDDIGAISEQPLEA